LDQAQLLERHEEHLVKGQCGVAEIGHLRVSLQAVKGCIDQGRLAGPHFAYQGDEAPAFPNPVNQGGEHLPVARAKIEELGVRRDLKRLFSKTKE